MVQYGFYHNADDCVGCKTCVIACKDKNDLAVGQKIRRVYDYAGAKWDVSSEGVCEYSDLFAYSLSVSCMHCESPMCMAACSTGAIVKRDEDGIVYIDHAKCNGCGSCVTACPYGQPFIDESKGHAMKCDMCLSLLKKGENPACVDACVARALKYGDIEELRATYGTLDAMPPIPGDTGTGPSMVFTPNRNNPDCSLEGMVTSSEDEIL